MGAWLIFTALPSLSGAWSRVWALLPYDEERRNTRAAFPSLCRSKSATPQVPVQGSLCLQGTRPQKVGLVTDNPKHPQGDVALAL